MRTLYTTTLTLLKNRPRTVTFEIIETETGLKHDWLARLSCGQISNPSVNKIEKLYNFLSKKPLLK